MTNLLYREALIDEARARRGRVHALWQPHEDVRRFLRDHVPDAWARVQGCRMEHRYWQSLTRPGHHKLAPYACHEYPYCIACVRAAGLRRTWQALERFSRCTPAGETPRFLHVVITAPCTEEGQGWGVAASRDVGRFARVVRLILTDLYGQGIGGVMSYQDFGERGFAKRHPHMDVTLNGWVLDRDVARPLPRLELAGGGYAWAEEVSRNRARCFQIDAGPSNFHIGCPIEGIRSYVRVLRYQMRELVDLRKLNYPRSGDQVAWRSYRHDTQERMTVAAFLYGLQEYRDRLGVWSQGQGSRWELHRGFGHMAKGTWTRTARLLNGPTLLHPQGCECGQCEDWRRLRPQELEGLVPPPERLEAPA